MNQTPKHETDSTAIPGYDFGSSEAAHSPLTLEEARQIEATVGWTQDDAGTLLAHREIFERNAEKMVDARRAVIAKQPHLAK